MAGTGLSPPTPAGNQRRVDNFTPSLNSIYVFSIICIFCIAQSNEHLNNLTSYMCFVLLGIYTIAIMWYFCTSCSFERGEFPRFMMILQWRSNKTIGRLLNTWWFRKTWSATNVTRRFYEYFLYHITEIFFEWWLINVLWKCFTYSAICHGTGHALSLDAYWTLLVKQYTL